MRSQALDCHGRASRRWAKCVRRGCAATSGMSAAFEIAGLDAVGQADLVRRGDVSAVARRRRQPPALESAHAAVPVSDDGVRA